MVWICQRRNRTKARHIAFVKCSLPLCRFSLSSSERRGAEQRHGQLIVHVPFDEFKVAFHTDFCGMRLVPRFKRTANECVARSDLAEILISE
jgi:hypothetical protein